MSMNESNGEDEWVVKKKGEAVETKRVEEGSKAVGYRIVRR